MHIVGEYKRPNHVIHYVEVEAGLKTPSSSTTITEIGKQSLAHSKGGFKTFSRVTLIPSGGIWTYLLSWMTFEGFIAGFSPGLLKPNVSYVFPFLL